ncbi:MAG: sensor histidine kinase [Alphaproteobacteria bacterium]
MTERQLRRRAYTQSSSFIMALCFSILLGASCVFLAFTIYSFSNAMDSPETLIEWAWQRKTLFVLSVIVISAMMLVILMSFFISIYVVNRINKIAKTAHRIIETDDLSDRIDISTSWDDLSFLAGSINKLIERVEKLMLGVRHVSDNVAHDLRTPLTRFRNHLEMNAGQEIGVEERQKLIDEADNLLNTFGTVLRISQLESRGQTGKFGLLRLEELIEDVVDFYGPVGEERSIEIRTSGRQQIVADKDLLFQLFANIIDNAMKFSPDNSLIEIEVGGSAVYGSVTVRDQGPGLSEEDMLRVTERFYRADHSRSTKGSGLGLSMAKAIIDLHKGNIEFSAANPGLEVTINLKKQDY